MGQLRNEESTKKKAAWYLTDRQHANSSGSNLANYTYSYDLASRLTQEQDNGTTTNYGYDARNQLTSAGSSNYSYDLNGNRTMTGYQTGTENEITNDGIWTYTYDAEGNITQKSKGSSAETWTYGYDNLNHMIWAQDRSTPGGTLTLAATYTYDVFGNRLEKDVWQTGGSTTTTRFAYDGQDVWADLSGGNALQTRYIRGDLVDQIFARISSGGTAAWYLTDRQGSVRNLTDASGTLQDTITYDGFGNATESSSSFGDRYKYTGRELDAETGLQYNRARYYGPGIGRWSSQDPTAFASGDTNLYRYVDNNPISFTDPTGLWLIDRAGGDYATAKSESRFAVTLRRGKIIGIDATPLDTIRSLALQAGLQPNEFRRWLTIGSGKPTDSVWVDQGILVPRTLTELKTDDVIANGETVRIPNVVATVWFGDLSVPGEIGSGFRRSRTYLKDLGFSLYRPPSPGINPSPTDALVVLTGLGKYLRAKRLHGLFVVGHGEPPYFGTGWTKPWGHCRIYYDELEEDQMNWSYHLPYVHMNLCDGESAKGLLSNACTHIFWGAPGCVWPIWNPFGYETFKQAWEVFPPGAQGTNKDARIPGLIFPRRFWEDR